MVVGLHLAWVASLWTAVQTTATVSDETRASVHSRLVGPGSEQDVDQNPALGLAITSGKYLGLSLAYTPLISIHDVSRPDERATTFLHNGSVALMMSGSDYHLSLSQRASFGTQSFATLQPPAIDPNAPVNPTMPHLELIPAVQTAPIVSLGSRAGFDYNWNRQWQSGLSAFYSVSGGRGAEAQKTLPLVKSYGAAATTGVVLSRDDRMGVNVNVGKSETSGLQHGNYVTLMASMGWSHQFWRGFSGQLTLGGYGDRSTNPGFTPRYTLSTTGLLALSVDFVRQRNFAIWAAVGGSVVPAINQLTGALERRFQGTGGLFAQVDQLTFNVGGDVTESLPQSDPQAVRLFGFNGGVRYLPSPLITISAEYRTAWQSARDPLLSRGQVWSALVGVALRAPPTKF
jgi:hypothetical protein